MIIIKWSIRFIGRRKFHSNSFCKMTNQHEDNRLETFCRVCEQVGEERSYLNKAKILGKFFNKGSDGNGFKGDTLLWVQMLIPGATQRVYNLQNKQMLKLFARLFVCDQQDMQLDVEQEGDISETLQKFFANCKKLAPQNKSTLYLHDVDTFLTDLEQRTKEDEQSELLRKLCKKATALDLKMIIRLIKQDLRINARASHILAAFGPFAYPAYQSSRDLAGVVQQFAGKSNKDPKQETTTKVKSKNASGVQVMTPISPMLANACKSVEDAFKKSPQGLFSEIKYDGERVQIHKNDNEFKFFSRNLKPVMNHKVKRFTEFIPKAFPDVATMILDSEIILVDTTTGDLLPFGTLGAHKKKEHANAEVCLFVFDCLYFDGEDLTPLSFRERRKILENNIKPLKSYVQLSESKFLKNPQELAFMTAKVLKANLEGVVLKDANSSYQPGKRGWLKVKKDYLLGGQMADTADLVVLGAWYGSGKKGGILSIFLMGCYDQKDKLWKTVTKVHSGLDDATNDEVHEKLLPQMSRADVDNLPNWLLCKRSLVPDFLAKNPRDMPVWEITGAEFTKSEAHTAGGISIRFPRITRIRDDKSTEQADDLQRLNYIFEASKSNVKIDLLTANYKQEVDDNDDDDVAMQVNSKIYSTPKKEKVEKSPKSNNKSKEGSSKKAETPKKVKVKAESSITPRKSIRLSSKEEIVTPKKAKIDDQIEMEDKIKIPIKSLSFDSEEPKAGRCFASRTAYFNGNNKTLKDAQRVFEANGGKLTLTSKKADLIFYADTETFVDMEECRKKFKKAARHLNVKWIQDSIEAKNCCPHPKYAMVLKAS